MAVPYGPDMDKYILKRKVRDALYALMPGSATGDVAQLCGRIVEFILEELKEGDE